MHVAQVLINISCLSIEVEPNQQEDHPVWVLELSAGAAQHCKARREPNKVGKVTMRFQPKVIEIEPITLNRIDR